MDKTMHNFSSRLKSLRSKARLTQTDLAKKLNITRSSVNAWELGISAPSVPFVVELSRLFSVTTDYLLGMDGNIIISTNGLTEQQIAALLNTAQCFHDMQQDR